MRILCVLIDSAHANKQTNKQTPYTHTYMHITQAYIKAAEKKVHFPFGTHASSLLEFFLMNFLEFCFLFNKFYHRINLP